MTTDSLVVLISAIVIVIGLIVYLRWDDDRD